VSPDDTRTSKGERYIGATILIPPNVQSDATSLTAGSSQEKTAKCDVVDTEKRELSALNETAVTEERHDKTQADSLITDNRWVSEGDRLLMRTKMSRMRRRS
jgi:hypothetical protein